MLLDTVLHDVTLTEQDFLRISRMVYDHCGINLHDGKKELVRARLAKRLRNCQFKSFGEYIEYVENDYSGIEFSMLVDAISTNLTSFFRESEHFDYLQRTYLPQLIERRQKEGSNKIRVWSAGCSTGEEPYSLAITLLEAVSNSQSWDMKVLATDISTKVLDRAKAGIYEHKRVEPVSPGHRQKYLTLIRDNGEKFYQANNLLTSMIIFRYVNLTADWPVRGPIDFIFCRNVMIYFDKPTQQRLVNRFYDILHSGGLLFTGHSESLTGIDHNFKYVRPTIYARP